VSRAAASKDEPQDAPFLNLRGAGIAAFAVLILSWPILVLGGPVIYFDTISYLERGDAIAGMLSQLVGLPLEAPGQAASDTPREAGALRSAFYSLYVAVTSSTPLGLIVTCWLQTAAVLWALFALVPPLSQKGRLVLVGGGLIVAAISSLPWFASYAMPDILGAILPIYLAIVLCDFSGLRAWQAVVLACLATAALLSHYGNLALFAGLGLVVLACALWRGQLKARMVIAVALPLLAAVGANFVIGSAARDEGSVAPKRMPILLARSLEDGPARWYLAEACPEADYAICAMFETMPENITEFLWEEDGYRRATAEQKQAIREEETQILLEAFKRYPVQQTYALTRNSLFQVVSVGTDQMFIPNAGETALEPSSLSLPSSKEGRTPTIALFDIVVSATAFAALALLTFGCLRRWVPRATVDAFVIVVVALLINAVVFGGLSAPVDRYQSRLAWLIPALLVIAVAIRASRQELRGPGNADRFRTSS
jgi:hypothetical protein